jgi:hypothetical protein
LTALTVEKVFFLTRFFGIIYHPTRGSLICAWCGYKCACFGADDEASGERRLSYKVAFLGASM